MLLALVSLNKNQNQVIDFLVRRHPTPDTRHPPTLPPKPEIKSLIIDRRRTHAECALDDRKFGH